MLGGMSTDATDILLENVKPGSDGSSLLVEGLKVTHQVMMPGEAIDEMNRTAAHATTSALDRFEESKHTRRIDLWMWVQHEITVATTECIYGPSNPYRDSEIEKAFW